MVQIQKNIDLTDYNTFGVTAIASEFIDITTTEQLRELIQSPFYRSESHLILGGGSNILFTGNYPGLVIKIRISGIDIVHETESDIHLRIGAGESWHQLVMHCVKMGWGGIENLSLIPGTVGAAPIQNIGAYGVEIGERVERVEGIDAHSGNPRSFNTDECRFEYRESAFKVELKEKYFISSVTLSLSKKNHQFNVAYGAIADTLKQQNVNTLSVKAVSDAVIQIRQSKLPDPERVGNAGKLFKNPIIDRDQFDFLQRSYATIPSYPSDNQNIKVPAGWLIEQCGWKGKRINNIGVHPLQALVLVNYGGGTGKEILQLAQQIQSSVKEKFQVSLTPEVNII